MQLRWKTQSTVARLRLELDQLKSTNQFRSVATLTGVNFCSNDYLGLSRDSRLRQEVIAALDSSLQLSSTGSRLLSGHDEVWDSLEKQLASFVGSEASVYFSSGYLANIGLLTAILTPGGTVFSDSANHASIIDAIRLTRANKVVFPHGDLDALETGLRAARTASEKLIVVESIFSMDGDRAALEELYRLADRYDAGIVVDEAHATGVTGPNGRGLVAASGRPDCVLATVHTCGKALASMGAFVACSRTVRDYLINKARPYIFSTALPPYIAVQTGAAVKLAIEADQARKRLDQLSEYLRNSLQARKFDTGLSASQVIPVILGSNERALEIAQSLVERGFGVKAIRPPTVPPGTARLRLSVTAALQQSDVTELIEALENVR
jgi:8-amino-7-oxononanoate synthase